MIHNNLISTVNRGKKRVSRKCHVLDCCSSGFNIIKKYLFYTYRHLDCLFKTPSQAKHSTVPVERMPRETPKVILRNQQTCPKSAINVSFNFPIL